MAIISDIEMSSMVDIVRNEIRKDDMQMTEAEEIEAAFKLVCKKCGSENVRIDIEQGVDYGGETGWSSGHIAIGCNDCGQNDVYISI